MKIHLRPWRGGSDNTLPVLSRHATAFDIKSQMIFMAIYAIIAVDYFRDFGGAYICEGENSTTCTGAFEEPIHPA